MTDPAIETHDYTEHMDETPTVLDMSPVEVIVTAPVETRTHPSRELITEQRPLNALVAEPILPEHRARARARLTARGGTVVIGAPGVTLGTGYTITDGESVELTGRAAVHALCLPPENGPVSVHILAEYH